MWTDDIQLLDTKPRNCCKVGNVLALGKDFLSLDSRLTTGRSPTMSASWLRFPIYVNGQKLFDANPSDDLTTADAYDRMDCVFNNIEFCFAEGRMMDVTIFDRLDTLRDQIRDNLLPPFAQIEDLVDSIGSRYGFDEISHSDSMWIRRDDSGQVIIWVDRDKIVAEANKQLFG